MSWSSSLLESENAEDSIVISSGCSPESLLPASSTLMGVFKPMVENLEVDSCWVEVLTVWMFLGGF